MKNILLATDFTSISRNAIDYAFQIFENKIKSEEVEFILFHTHQTVASVPSPGGLPVSSEPQLLELNKERLKKDSELLKQKYPKATINQYFTVGGLLQALNSAVLEESVDLIVIGSVASSGMERWLMGSHAHEIAQHAACPVLVIPEKAHFKPLKKAVLATDFKNLNDMTILHAIQDLVKTYDSELMMLHIYAKEKTTEEEKTSMNAKLKQYFDIDDYAFYFLEHPNAVEGIEEFVSGYKADILTLIGQERGFFENLFHKSVTKEMVVHSEIPILVLHTTQPIMDAEKKASLKEKLESQVTKWRAEIEELNLQAHLGKKELEDELKEERKKAKEQLHKVKMKLDDLEDMAEDRWDHFRKEITEALGHVKKAFSKDD